MLVGSCAGRDRPNILLIVVDTLRADRLGCYGNSNGLTPFLDSLAADGFVFRNAYSASSWTNPAVASLLTSRYQSQHGILSFGSVLSDREITLPERLKEAGYATGAFSANGLIGEAKGFAQGYDEYQAILSQRGDNPRDLPRPKRAGEISQNALSWLKSLPKASTAPVFLYLHYMEPHTPYQPPEEILERVFHGRERPDLSELSKIAIIRTIREVDAETMRDVEDLYGAEIISLDLELRALFSELERRGFLDDALVVLAADHGEAFLDHGLIGHGHDLYNSVVRVPLIVLAPRQSEHADVTEVVSLVDIAPTLLDWLGEPIPETFEGRSLKAILAPQRGRWLPFFRSATERVAEPRTIYTELIKDPERDQRRFSPHLRAAINGSHKLITGVGGEHEFYDLAADPGETGSVALPEADRTALEEALRAFESRAVRHDGSEATPRIDETTRQRMQALGYHE